MPLPSAGNPYLTSSKHNRKEWWQCLGKGDHGNTTTGSTEEDTEAHQLFHVPPRGVNPLAIQVKTPSSLETYDTKESVFDNAAEHLSLQFWLAFTIPCYSSQLLNKIGHLTNTQCALDVLKGTYTFPPDTDKWTAKILQEAHHTYVLLGNKTIDTISVSDFQGYWQWADKSISSSYRRLHFGHYKAASFSMDLSALHAAK